MRNFRIDGLRRWDSLAGIAKIGSNGIGRNEIERAMPENPATGCESLLRTIPTAAEA